MVNKSTRNLMEWRLGVMMKDRGINSGAELQRRLAGINIHISSQNLSRLTNSEKQGPLRLSSELIYGLTYVLQCTVADLWVNPDHPEANYQKKRPSGFAAKSENVQSLHPAVIKKAKPKTAIEAAIGPKAELYDPPEAK